MIKLSSPKNYALIVGMILFALGFFGFAFRTNFSIGNQYLIASLVLGFWGIVAAFGSDKNQPL